MRRSENHREAEEALDVVKRLVKKDAEEFMRDVEARYALRYSLILLVEAMTDVIVLILEKRYNVAPESYKEAFLLAGEKGVLPYNVELEILEMAIQSLREYVKTVDP